MNRVGVVLPTIAGREKTLQTVLDAFERTCPRDTLLDITIPEDFASVGAGWNAGADDVDGEYLFFAIDDCVPHKGWCQTAMRTVDAGFIPAPRLISLDGSTESCGSLGLGATLKDCPDKTPCRNAGMIFVRDTWWEEIGEFLPIHYNADDDWNWRAALHGHQLLYRQGYAFTHLHDLTGAERVRRDAQAHFQQFRDHAMTLQMPGRVPA